MRTELRLHARVWTFCQALPPDPRKRLRAALSSLQNMRGDIKALEGRLSGYYRLRSGSYRVIFSVRVEKGTRTIFCHFADHRSTVYQILEAREHLRAFLE